MHIHIVAVGQKPPDWVSRGYQTYARRLQGECSLKLQEIAAARRSKGLPAERLRQDEGERMLLRVPRDAWVVALDESGQHWNTRQLAARFADWLLAGRDLCLLIGGPDGLAPACLERADCVWSLSRLTLPHALVRIVLAEQLYRAWSLYRNHPYHRD